MRRWAPIWPAGADVPHLGAGGEFGHAGGRFQRLDAATARYADTGYWSTYVAGVKEGDQYKFFVDGAGSTGWKRDPYARALTLDPPFPHCNCSVTQPRSFPWHDAGFRPPAFNDFVVYQLHVGAFWSVDSQGNDRRAIVPAAFSMCYPGSIIWSISG